MALGTETQGEGNSTFLSVAGGSIWDKKQGADHPQYAKQEYTKVDGEIGVREGAKYADLTGTIVDVRIGEHDQYGQSIQVTFKSEEDRYIVSIGTNNRYSQDMMKMLLKVNVNQVVNMKPYDFVDKQKGTRVQGIVFKQNGEKIALRNDDAPFKDSTFFKEATKKQKSRFFEDLTDWFVDNVKSEVIDVHFKKDESGEVASKPKAETVAKPKAEKVAKPKAEPVTAEVDDDDLDSQLDELL
jgi:hypothetical protein